MGEEICAMINGIEVELIKPFSVLRETLERIGIANKKEKKIFPSCYAKKEGGKVKIYQFKELLKHPNLNSDDIKRKNTIIWLLIKWNLIKITDNKLADSIFSDMLESKIFILPKQQKDKEEWNIIHKFHFEGREVQSK